MHQNTLMVSKALRDKVLIWFQQSNRYLVCDTVIHSMLEDLENGISPEALIKTIAQESELELKAIQNIVNSVITVFIVTAGANNGQSRYLNFCIPLAPSILDASSNSFGIFFKEAI